MRLCYGTFSISVNGEPTRVLHTYAKKNMVRYIRPHGRFAHCLCTTHFWPRIEIYYFSTNAQKLLLFDACKMCAKTYQNVKKVCAKVTSVRKKCAKSKKGISVTRHSLDMMCKHVGSLPFGLGLNFGEIEELFLVKTCFQKQEIQVSFTQ